MAEVAAVHDDLDMAVRPCDLFQDGNGIICRAVVDQDVLVSVIGKGRHHGSRGLTKCPDITLLVVARADDTDEFHLASPYPYHAAVRRKASGSGTCCLRPPTRARNPSVASLYRALAEAEKTTAGRWAIGDLRRKGDVLAADRPQRSARSTRPCCASTRAAAR